MSKITMLESLTPEQEAAMPGWVEKWVDIAYSTERANFDEAAQGVVQCYELINRVPKVILRTESPLGAVYGGSLAYIFGKYVEGCLEYFQDEKKLKTVLKKIKTSPAKLPDIPSVKYWHDLFDQIEGPVYKDFEKAWSEKFKDADDEILKQVFYFIKLHFEIDILSDNGHPPNQAKYVKFLNENWNKYRGIVAWTGWYAYVTFFRDVCGLELPIFSNFEKDYRVGMNCGWWWMFEDICAISDRPISISRTSENRLHNESGPSIEYSDGFKVWTIHGVRVNEQIVMRPETQTTEQIKQEQSEEIRRVRIERYGWERYIQDTHAKVISRNHDDISNQTELLVELEDGTRRMIVIDPSTSRRYVLGVPRDTQSAQDGQRYLSQGLSDFSVGRT